MTPALAAERLVRTFGALAAVDDVSFQLAPGALLTIFGPNGAGKTTLLRVLGGGLRPSSGSVLMGGEVLKASGTEWRGRVGVLSHQGFLYQHLSCAENLRFYGSLYGLSGLRDRIAERLDAVGLSSRADDVVRTLSRGMRQRLALARTLLHDPAVVLLDEPYTGLDVQAAAVLRQVLETLRDGSRTVVLVTHNITQGLDLADRVVIQVRGRFVFDEPRAGLDVSTFEAVYRQVVEASA